MGVGSGVGVGSGEASGEAMGVKSVAFSSVEAEVSDDEAEIISGEAGVFSDTLFCVERSNIRVATSQAEKNAKQNAIEKMHKARRFFICLFITKPSSKNFLSLYYYCHIMILLILFHRLKQNTNPNQNQNNPTKNRRLRLKAFAENAADFNPRHRHTQRNHPNQHHRKENIYV